eukprot:6061722-Prymnesium_polylepis.1
MVAVMVAAAMAVAAMAAAEREAAARVAVMAGAEAVETYHAAVGRLCALHELDAVVVERIFGAAVDVLFPKHIGARVEETDGIQIVRNENDHAAARTRRTNKFIAAVRLQRRWNELERGRRGRGVQDSDTSRLVGSEDDLAVESRRDAAELVLGADDVPDPNRAELFGRRIEDADHIAVPRADVGLAVGGDGAHGKPLSCAVRSAAVGRGRDTRRDGREAVQLRIEEPQLVGVRGDEEHLAAWQRDSALKLVVAGDADGHVREVAVQRVEDTYAVRIAGRKDLCDGHGGLETVTMAGVRCARSVDAMTGVRAA